MGKLTVGVAFIALVFAAFYMPAQYVPPGGGGSGNATTVNGAAIPTSKTCVGTNSSGQFIDASSNCAGATSLESHTASTSSSLDFTSCLATSGYSNFYVVADGLVLGTSGADVWLRFSTNGGSTYDSGNNYFSSIFRFTGVASAISGTANTGIDHMPVTAGAGATLANWSIDFRFDILHPASSTLYKKVNVGPGSIYDGTSTAANPLVSNVGSGQYANTTAVNAFRLLPSSGNFTVGTVRCYGYPN